MPVGCGRLEEGWNFHQIHDAPSLAGATGTTHDAAMDPRYPVGKFALDNDVTAEKRRQCIAQLASLPSDVTHALRDMPPGGLDTRYRDGGWTARQVVHHLADSHSNAFTRIKLALTEDSPALKTYEEQLWAELADARMDPAPSVAILEGVHARLTTLLESLTSDQFDRQASHPQWGAVSVDFLVQLYAWHCRHHLAHLRLAADRARLGAPVT
jgi:hypothetical protein